MSDFRWLAKGLRSLSNWPAATLPYGQVRAVEARGTSDLCNPIASECYRKRSSNPGKGRDS